MKVFVHKDLTVESEDCKNNEIMQLPDCTDIIKMLCGPPPELCNVLNVPLSTALPSLQDQLKDTMVCNVLDDRAVAVFRNWINNPLNEMNPYPSQMEIEHMSSMAGTTIPQAEKWFSEYRYLEWSGRASIQGPGMSEHRPLISLPGQRPSIGMSEYRPSISMPENYPLLEELDRIYNAYSTPDVRIDNGHEFESYREFSDSLRVPPVSAPSYSVDELLASEEFDGGKGPCRAVLCSEWAWLP
jgi:hypothetical protein